MIDFLPIFIVGAIIGTLSLCFLVAYAILRRKEKAAKSERTMSDRELIRRLLSYAKPYKREFVIVFIVMLLSIAYDLLSPVLVGQVEELVKIPGFALSELYWSVAIYTGVLVISMVSMYVQTMILQKTGQKILSS